MKPLTNCWHENEKVSVLNVSKLYDTDAVERAANTDRMLFVFEKCNKTKK